MCVAGGTDVGLNSPPHPRAAEDDGRHEQRARRATYLRDGFVPNVANGNLGAGYWTVSNRGSGYTHAARLDLAAPRSSSTLRSTSSTVYASIGRELAGRSNVTLSEGTPNRRPEFRLGPLRRGLRTDAAADNTLERPTASRAPPRNRARRHV